MNPITFLFYVHLTFYSLLSFSVGHHFTFNDRVVVGEKFGTLWDVYWSTCSESCSKDESCSLSWSEQDMKPEFVVFQGTKYRQLKIQTKCEPDFPKDGDYTSWSPWEYSVTCGSGVQSRRRTCTNPPPRNGGKDCKEIGPAEETKKYNKPACLIDGNYTEWSPWEKCSVTCGSGVQTRRRNCTNPPPSNGGKDCTVIGPANETKECNETACPIDGKYIKWSPWENCSVTCGSGVQARRRTCTNPPPSNGGKDCKEIGPAAETKNCYAGVCIKP